MAKISWEHGFKRLIFVLSLISLILFETLIFIIFIENPEDREILLVGAIGLVIILIVPWVLFFLIRFIIKGFCVEIIPIEDKTYERMARVDEKSRDRNSKGVKMTKWLANLAQWVLLIIAIAIAFYIVYPKYDFCPVTLHQPGVMGGRDKTIYICRCNKFTGQVEFVETRRIPTFEELRSSKTPALDRLIDLGPAPAEGPKKPRLVPDEP